MPTTPSPMPQDFSSQDLSKRSFAGADLTRAIFKDALLVDVDFTSAILDGADSSHGDRPGHLRGRKSREIAVDLGRR